MNSQERQLIEGLFDRLSQVAGAPQDAEAGALISLGQQRVPNATYTLVQTVLLQDEALRQMSERIAELERAAAPPAPAQESPGFLDAMRSSVFGQGGGARGSVPSVQPGATQQSRPSWNSGELLNQGQPQAGAPGGGFGNYGGQPQQPPQAAPGRGGGSFLGTAAAAAAGAVGGSLLMNSLGSMFGGSRAGAQSLTDTASKSGSETQSPWSSGASDSNLSKDAGLNDIGSSNPQRSFDDQQSGYQDANDNGYDDEDDDGHDDDYGDDSDDGSYDV